ncbi:MAG: fibronectin type III domain-containing protein, partial [Anaerolineae bacterium]|nr:fibronectin type III domain-containing protein [Anaerolineae bacterium]
IKNEGSVYFSMSALFNDNINCTGEGKFIDQESNLQGRDESCGKTIPVVDELPYESYIVTSFSVSDVTMAEDGTYTISLYWASYEVENFRVVVEPLNWNASRVITLNVEGGADVYESALVSGLDCGTEYTVYVEGLSADERVVRGRSYKISVLTPGCG